MATIEADLEVKDGCSRQEHLHGIGKGDFKVACMANDAKLRPSQSFTR